MAERQRGTKRPRNSDDGEEGLTDIQAAQKRRLALGGRNPMRASDARCLQAMLVTCHRGKERGAGSEVMGMLSDLAESQFPAPVDDTAAPAVEADDVLGDLAAEVAALTKPVTRSQPWFRPVGMKNQCLALIALNPAHPRHHHISIDRLALDLLAKWRERGRGEGRFAARIHPLPHTCFPDVRSVVEVLQGSLKDFLAAKQSDGKLAQGSTVKVCITIKARSVARGLKPAKVLTPVEEGEGGGEQGSAAPAAGAGGSEEEQAPTHYLHNDVGMPALKEVVNAAFAAAGLNVVLVYKGADVYVEAQAAQNVAGVGVYLHEELQPAWFLNLQKAREELKAASEAAASEAAASEAAASAAVPQSVGDSKV